jgi:hypothetical protein
MPINTAALAALKLTLAKPDPVEIDPRGAYIRIAKVKRVFLTSRLMDVQFIDGGRDGDDKFLEPPESVLTIVGSNDPLTTYVPSAAVYGKGDLVAILVLSSATTYSNDSLIAEGLEVMPFVGDKFAVSLMDFYGHINRVNFATIKGWALYDVLGGLCIDGRDDGAESYLTFRCPETGIVTRINGDTDDDEFGFPRNNLFKRLADHFISERTAMMPITTTDTPNHQGRSYDVACSGPENNFEKRINGILHKGRHVNGFPYVELLKYGQADLTADLTCFHSTEAGMATAPAHPDGGNVVSRFFDRAAVVWFDDEEPTHVVIAGCWPSFVGSRYVMFLEVPVYSLTGRKFLEREVVDEGLPTERMEIVDSWCLYADQVREIGSIDRSLYLSYWEHGGAIELSEQYHKGLLVHAARQTGEEINFGIMDSCGLIVDGFRYDTNLLWRWQGKITRSPREVPHVNGSLYDYNLQLPENPESINLGVDVLFVYDWNDGEKYETQTVVDPTIEYPCYDDGVNTMHRRIDLDYYCNGQYEDNIEETSGLVGWSDGGTGSGGISEINNTCRHHTYRNGELRFTDVYLLRWLGVSVWGSQTLYVSFYADVDYDLFVVEKIETVIDEGSCTTGPGGPCTGTQKVSGVVIFQGVEYVIWEYVTVLSEFPTIWNTHPWVKDNLPREDPENPGNTIIGAPNRPTSTPYLVNEVYTNAFWYEPFYEYRTGTLRPGYSSYGIGYPTHNFGAATLNQNAMLKTEDRSLPDDLLRVSIDKEYDSFAIRFESYLVDDPAKNKTLKYTNNGTTEDGEPTLFRFNGGTPHFNNPAPTSIIELSPAPPLP